MGLRLDAEEIGLENTDPCPRCRTTGSKKLDRERVEALAYRFFVRGSIHRAEYGGAPAIQMNPQHHRKSDEPTTPWLRDDIATIEDVVEIGFFHYGPRLWMIGEVEPLKSLQNKTERRAVIDRILQEYPDSTIKVGERFYRLRKNPVQPSKHEEYDSPPDEHCGHGRLCTKNLPVLYASQDLELCVHECRATVEDDLYVATLEAERDLRLLDLIELIDDEESEFESIDMAVHMLFLAGRHSYNISREIAGAAQQAGYDGLIFPSYFSLLRTGAVPFDTIYGISVRRIPQLADHARAQSIPNFGLFGRPIEAGTVKIACINRLVLSRVDIDYLFGPVEY